MKCVPFNHSLTGEYILYLRPDQSWELDFQPFDVSEMQADKASKPRLRRGIRPPDPAKFVTKTPRGGQQSRSRKPLPRRPTHRAPHLLHFKHQPAGSDAHTHPLTNLK